MMSPMSGDGKTGKTEPLDQASVDARYAAKIRARETGAVEVNVTPPPSRQTKVAKSRNLWGDEDAPHLSEQERASAVQAFSTAASRLLESWRPRARWTEAEQLAMRLANQIAIAFVNPPGPGYEQVFRDALEAFVDTTLQKKRAIAVSAVATRAVELASGDRGAVDRLVLDLEATDMTFAVLGKRLDELAARLAMYDPRPKINTGKKSAESILAALIVDIVGPAVGFAPSEYRSPVDAVEAFRSALARDLSKFLSPGK
jgi:hypothetical protein